MRRGAVFLDRDGTIIEDVGYISDPEQVQLMRGAPAALRSLAGVGWPLIVVSNQSGVGRGLISPEQANSVHERFVQLLASSQVSLSASYYCFHLPSDNCNCRKPGTGLLERASRDHAIELSMSVVVGDKVSDVEAGVACGCRCFLVGASPSEGCSDWSVVPELGSAAELVLGEVPGVVAR